MYSMGLGVQKRVDVNEGLLHVEECTKLSVQGVHFFMDGPGFTKTSPEDVGTSVNYIFPSSWGVHGMGWLIWA